MDAYMNAVHNIGKLPSTKEIFSWFGNLIFQLQEELWRQIHAQTTIEEQAQK